MQHKIRFHMTKRDWMVRKYHPDCLASRGWIERMVMNGYDDTSRALNFRQPPDVPQMQYKS